MEMWGRGDNAYPSVDECGVKNKEHIFFSCSNYEIPSLWIVENDSEKPTNHNDGLSNFLERS